MKLGLVHMTEGKGYCARRQERRSIKQLQNFVKKKERYIVIPDSKEKGLTFDLLFRAVKFSQLYCKQHVIKLIHNRIIENQGVFIEIGYCPKCQKEYCEYSDISPVYISNYDWLYED